MVSIFVKRADLWTFSQFDSDDDSLSWRSFVIVYKTHDGKEIFPLPLDEYILLWKHIVAAPTLWGVIKFNHTVTERWSMYERINVLVARIMWSPLCKQKINLLYIYTTSITIDRKWKQAINILYTLEYSNYIIDEHNLKDVNYA